MINESLIGEFAVPNAHQILALNKLEVEDIRTYQVSHHIMQKNSSAL